MKSLMHSMAGLALLLPLAVNAATLGSYPADETCQADREASYADGYSLGYSTGESNGWNLGHQAGHDFGIRSCVADPLQFGVTLASVIPAASYGETEPNDNFIAADPLAQGVNFWGQLYGQADQDWFYTETTAPNQNILVTFSVPYWISGVNLLEGLPAVWNISVRDAAGNIFANYNTNVMGAIDSYDQDRETYYSMTYSITAGLAGTYYIVVKPVDDRLICGEFCNVTAYPYSVATVVQDSPLVNNQPVVGFFDAEVEPNDVPSRANPLANGVSMYGLINLTFEGTYPVDTGQTDDDGNAIITSRWGQGEADWFVYESKGNEIVTLTFCSKDQCGLGDWFVQVFDQPSANALESGVAPDQVRPLLAFNTNLYQCDDPATDAFEFCTTEEGDGVYPRDSEAYRIGLRDPGYYFVRIGHIRLFTAPCASYSFVSALDSGGFVGSCGCSNGGNDCMIPSNQCESGDILCINAVTDSCVPGVQPGCQEACTTEGEGEAATETCNYWLTNAVCACSQYGSEVAVPSVYTSPYNFTWHGSQLPPSTIDTDAYEDYLNRPNPYTP
ncbi:hypothetical protein [Allochromatium palmeri]|uniref:Uncharacterized protein n=1 Tax=Allochromatium palmeri TaxID=231048 RepID=A0A6N8E7L5_9GAMM|nr:hypothetical protein [Allochromatium palmeri]MTW19571.1 hypothetical protein [Allochromatium palmeri]